MEQTGRRSLHPSEEAVVISNTLYYASTLNLFVLNLFGWQSVALKATEPDTC